MQNNTIFKIIGSLMILLTIMAVVNATTISNVISILTGNLDAGTNDVYNATNINATNFYATSFINSSTLNVTNLWIGTKKVNTTTLLPNSCSNSTVAKYDTATGTWLCQSDTDTDTTYTNGTGLNLTSTTFYLDLNYVDGVYVKRNTWTSIDNYPSACSSGQFISALGDTSTCGTPSDVSNVTSIQFTGTSTKTLNLEQGGITNRTATWTDLDTVYNTTNIQFTGTATKTFSLEQTGSSAISNLTTTFTDLTNSSADIIRTINNTAGLYTFRGLNISTESVNLNAQNITLTQNTGGIILNQSQAHFSIQQNTSGCVVIKGFSSTLNVC